MDDTNYAYHDLEYQIPILHERVKFTRTHCPECQQHFVAWQDTPSGAMNALCFEGHSWVTERYIDHGNWNTEESE